VTGGWRKLHNEELHGLYSSPDIIRIIKPRRMRWGHTARTGETISAYKILVRKPEEKRQLRWPRRRRDDNIKMDLRDGVDWIYLAQVIDWWRALVNTVMNIRFP
jgi:hypothetical protein